MNRLAGVLGGAQSAGSGNGCDDFANISLNDGRLAIVDLIDSCLNRVDAGDLKSILCETPGTNRSDVIQAEDADLQSIVPPNPFAGLNLPVSARSRRAGCPAGCFISVLKRLRRPFS